MRYEFGKNWQSFNKSFLSLERINIVKESFLNFLHLDNLDGKTFLDIGSGSGLQSLAAYNAGAERIFSFDYDSNAVEATKSLWRKSGRPKNWTICQGSILDSEFVNSLGEFDIVYSWGVLHHTGDLWNALKNSKLPLKSDGVLYVSLYAKEAYQDPPQEYWLELKQKYNKAGFIERKKIEITYIYQILMDSKIRNIYRLIKMIITYKKNRGMALWTDIKDWLGGWPMEFSSANEVYTYSLNKLNLCLINLKMGSGCTEYLFEKKNIGSWNYYSNNQYDNLKIERSIIKSFNHYFEKMLIRLENEYGGLIQNIPQTIKSELQPKKFISNSNKEGVFYLCQGGDRMKSEYHNYAPIYASFLKDYIGLDGINIAEVGILMGTGLAIWSDVFINGNIFGFDINLSNYNNNYSNLKEKGAFINNNVNVFEFDQYDNNSRLLKKVNSNKFDIVIDDGIHDYKAVASTLDSFVPNLKDNFIYFIEDVPNEYIPDIKELHNLIIGKYPHFSIYYENQLSVITNNS